MSGLLDSLNQAMRETTIGGTGCKVCDLIQSTEDKATREALITTAAGSIGERKFVEVMRAHGTGIGRDVLRRHRQEGHQP